jgi:hypothetical protein
MYFDHDVNKILCCPLILAHPPQQGNSPITRQRFGLNTDRPALKRPEKVSLLRTKIVVRHGRRRREFRSIAGFVSAAQEVPKKFFVFLLKCNF